MTFKTSILCLSALASVACGSLTAQESITSGDKRLARSGAVDYVLERESQEITIRNAQGQVRSFQAHAFQAMMYDVLAPDFSVPEKTLVRGVFITAAAVNERTGVVAVGVHAQYMVATSWSFVVTINTDSWKVRLVQVPKVGKTLGFGETNDLRDILGLTYTSAGRLVIRQASASGAESAIVFNPNLRFHSCQMTVIEDEGEDHCADLF